jgi:hypothetical protein
MCGTERAWSVAPTLRIVHGTAHGVADSDALVAQLEFCLHREIPDGKVHPLGNNTRTISH